MLPRSRSASSNHDLSPVASSACASHSSRMVPGSSLATPAPVWKAQPPGVSLVHGRLCEVEEQVQEGLGLRPSLVATDLRAPIKLARRHEADDHIYLYERHNCFSIFQSFWYRDAGCLIDVLVATSEARQCPFHSKKARSQTRGLTDETSASGETCGLGRKVVLEVSAQVSQPYPARGRKLSLL